jgi:uncharacterized membrane protein YoaK (UPF0700 family)
LAEAVDKLSQYADQLRPRSARGRPETSSVSDARLTNRVSAFTAHVMFALGALAGALAGTALGLRVVAVPAIIWIVLLVLAMRAELRSRVKA